MSTELENLTKISDKVTLNDGRVIEVSKIKVKQLSPILKAVKSIPFDMIGKDVKSEHVISLVADHIGVATELVTILTTMPREEVEELDLDDMIAIITVMLEVNIDFFTKSVLPLLLEAMGKFSKNVKKPVAAKMRA